MSLAGSQRLQQSASLRLAWLSTCYPATTGLITSSGQCCSPLALAVDCFVSQSRRLFDSFTSHRSGFSASRSCLSVDSAACNRLTKRNQQRNRLREGCRFETFSPLYKIATESNLSGLAQKMLVRRPSVIMKSQPLCIALLQ